MLNSLNKKQILIGVTGGVAAYKVLELIRRLKEHGALVKVVLSANAEKFITPLSVEALGAEKITESAMTHIDLARWAEVLLIAPTSANFMAKLAHGLADDLLSTICLATTAPILVAPAMNQQMWLNTATQANLKILQQRAITILGPALGSQACGEFGPGRMLEAQELLQALDLHFTPKLFANKHIVITAGPTQENIDPVRYISNHSSGKMGYALAEAALKLGAKVTLISGPTSLAAPISSNLHLILAISAAQMYEATMQTLKHKIDIFIGCAAVADYRPKLSQEHKIKKSGQILNLELEPTEDILRAVANLASKVRPLTIGFAAETENLQTNAQQKLISKNLDLIIANLVNDGAVFNQDENQVLVLARNQAPVELSRMPKQALAYELLQLMHAALNANAVAVNAHELELAPV